MKILICFEKDSGGETSVTRSLIEAFKKNKNVELKHYARSPLAHTDFLRYFFWLFNSILQWFFVILKQKNTDWVYVSTYTAGVAATVLKPFIKIKICFHYNGSRVPEITTRFTQRIKVFVSLSLHNIFIKNCDLIIVPSEFSKKEFKKEFKATKGRKIVSIYNGVGLIKRPDKNKALLKKSLFSISKNTKVVLIVGRIDRLKNITSAIYAFNEVTKTHPNIHLAIAYPKVNTSDGIKYKDEIYKLIEKLKLTNKVTWIKDPKNISQLYVASDLVLNLSSRENLPLTLVEAFTLGVPFSGTSVGGVTEVLSKIDSNLLIETNASIKGVAKSLLKNLYLSNKAKRNICNKYNKIAILFDIDAIAERIYRLLTK